MVLRVRDGSEHLLDSDHHCHAFPWCEQAIGYSIHVTAVGRCVSQLQGWYEERRAVQLKFIVVLLIVSALFLGALLWLMRGRLKNKGLALLGLALVSTFVVVRAVGFQHVDVLINTRVHDIRFNVLLELSGLVLIFINAIWLLIVRQETVPA